MTPAAEVPTNDLSGVRLLLVLGESTGGIGRHVKQLAQHCARGGAAVTVCCPAATAARLEPLGSGIAVVTAAVGHARPRAQVEVRRVLRGLAAEHDVVHAHGLRAAAAAAGALRRRTRPAVVATWHNAPLRSGLVRRVLHLAAERRAASGCAVTWGASPDLVARAWRSGARDARDCFIPAPPPTARRPGERDRLRRDLGAADRALVVAVGRLHPQKRLDVLVAAAATWRHDPSGPLVVIAGDGPLRKELGEQIERTGAPVRLLGAWAGADALIEAADVVALPSAWEARALVAQETLRAGVPLVAAAVGGLPELVGDAALLVAPGDPAAVAAAVRRLLSDSALCSDLAAAGRRQAASWPSATTALDVMTSAYLTLRSRPDPVIAAGPDTPAARGAPDSPGDVP